MNLVKPDTRKEGKEDAGRPAVATARARVTIRYAWKPTVMGNYCVRGIEPGNARIFPRFCA